MNWISEDIIQLVLDIWSVVMILKYVGKCPYSVKKYMLKYLGLKCHDVYNYFQMIQKNKKLEIEGKQVWQNVND